MAEFKQSNKSDGGHFYSVNFSVLKKTLLTFLLVAMTLTAIAYVFLYRHYQISAHQSSIQRDSPVTIEIQQSQSRETTVINSDTAAFSQRLFYSTIRVSVLLITVFGFLLLVVRVVFDLADQEVDKYHHLLAMNDKPVGEMTFYGTRTPLPQSLSV